MMKKSIFMSVATALAIACGPTDNQTLTVVPYPNEVEICIGEFNAAGAGFHYSADFDDATKNIINGFAQQLSLVTGNESLADENDASEGFIFVMDPSIPEEAYSLTVSRKAVTVKASSLRGVNYAVQTIKQMLPVEIYGKTAAPDKEWALQCAEINDAPRFGYRGLHLDVSRHFFDMDMVRKYLDIMEVHKLNKLHWHLTDDQGWRIEIKKYPKLTEIGSIRKETLTGHLSNSNTYDGTPYGEGCWYTQDQIKEIIDYAAAKGIDIIPEIDLPGHMLAALAAYPQYGCTGGPYDVWGRWGISDDVLCAGNEKTMVFLEDILAEVAELFPYEYVHIGGDECPKVKWETCPKCQAKIRELGLKDENGYKAEHYLQSYVMERMTKFLESRGKKIIGWDELLEGKVGESATIMSWRGTAGGLKAVRLGNDAIMTPNTFFYLDYHQSRDTENEPLGIGGYLPVEKCYSYEPYTEDMTDEEKARILGVQANMWTEYIGTNEHLEYMLLPRMTALSEVQWCQPENKSWERFTDNSEYFCSIYDIMGYNYADHIFNVRGTVAVNHEKNCVEVSLDSQNEIRYTIDGSEPTMKSAVYTKPLEIRGSCTVKAASIRNGEFTKQYEKVFTHHKAMGRPVQALTQPREKYRFNYPDQLTDGIRSKGPFGNGDFVGWRKDPFGVIIEMDGTPYNTVTLSTIVSKSDNIFNPLDLIVYTSEDGNEFTEAARDEYPVEGGMDDGNGCQEYTVTFPETSAKFLKVTAERIASMPEWHNAKGRTGYLFVDEVIVK